MLLVASNGLAGSLDLHSPFAVCLPILTWYLVHPRHIIGKKGRKTESIPLRPLSRSVRNWIRQKTEAIDSIHAQQLTVGFNYTYMDN